MLLVYEISWEPHGISYSPDFLEILMKISCHVSPREPRSLACAHRDDIPEAHRCQGHDDLGFRFGVQTDPRAWDSISPGKQAKNGDFRGFNNFSNDWVIHHEVILG